MSNVYDYLEWRGDIPFSFDGYNEVDGLIMSQFSYLELDGIMPGGFEQPKTVAEIGELYFKKYSKKRIASETSVFRNATILLEHLMVSRRYKDIKVYNYNEQYDSDARNAMQFGAVLLKIGTDNYVAFRGTDDTLAGWQEDFQVCYKMPVASQQEAEEYLLDSMKHMDGNFYVLGHSKGGNLAMYSAMRMPEHHKKRIVGIYNYDGPGFKQEVEQGELYQSIRERVHSYMPKESIVGMIMYHESAYTIVDSDRKGIMQHLVENWNVHGPSFETCKEFKSSSKIFHQACEKWIEEISDEDRAYLIEVVFKVLSSGGDSFADMKEDGMSAVNSVLKSLHHLDKEQKKIAAKVLSEMFKLSTQSITENITDSIFGKG